jgi:broad specificity phosphatase PhoE
MDETPAGKIILVRHGETEANRQRRFAESDDILLTDLGCRQAREVALRIAREFRPELVVSSAFLRARQTAESVANVLGLKAEVLPGLHERDFGCLRGQPYERMGELMLGDAAYDPVRPWLWAPPEGETLDSVRARAMAALASLRDRPLPELVVVCHGAVIQAVCAHITGEWNESFVPPNCGFAVIGFDGDNWREPVLSSEWIGLAERRFV